MPLGAEDFKAVRGVGSGMAWIRAIPHGERVWGILDVGVGVAWWGCFGPVVYPFCTRTRRAGSGWLTSMRLERPRSGIQAPAPRQLRGDDGYSLLHSPVLRPIVVGA